jgi:hypothetical protein
MLRDRQGAGTLSGNSGQPLEHRHDQIDGALLTRGDLGARECSAAQAQ